MGTTTLDFVRFTVTLIGGSVRQLSYMDVLELQVPAGGGPTTIVFRDSRADISVDESITTINTKIDEAYHNLIK